jgi:hypothetical protein
VNAIVSILEGLGFRETRIERQEGVDRQTMTAVIALK